MDLSHYSISEMSESYITTKTYQCKKEISSLPIFKPLGLFRPHLLHVIVSNAPKAKHKSRQTSSQSHPVSTPITFEPFQASELSIIVNIGMMVIDAAVDQVEDITEKNGRQSHRTPVLRQTSNAKRSGDQRWVNAKKEAVGHCTT